MRGQNQTWSEYFSEALDSSGKPIQTVMEDGNSSETLEALMSANSIISMSMLGAICELNETVEEIGNILERLEEKL